MNKSVVAVGVALVIAAGAYGANTYLVGEVSEQLPIQVTEALVNLDNEFVEFRVLSSQSEGNAITQQIAAYLFDNGQQIGEPLFFKHFAEVGLFGVKVNGSISLPKDKGAAKEFIDAFSSFNESINYTLSTTTQHLDLIGELDVDEIVPSDYERLKIGKIVLTVKGNETDYVSNVSLDGVNFKEFYDSISIGQVDFVVNQNGDDQTALFTADRFEFVKDLHSGKESVAVQGVSLKSTVSMAADTIVANDWQIDNVQVLIPGVNLPPVKLGFTSEMVGLDLKKIEELSQSNVGFDATHVERAAKELYGAGFDIKNINFHVNDSTIDGFVKLKPADYSEVPSYQITKVLGANIVSEFDVKITKKLVAAVKLPPQMLAHYMTEEDDKFVGEIKLENGELLLNGKKI